MEILPKQKDVQMEILNKMDDKTLIDFCHTNSETLDFCNTNQQFWLNRIISKFNIPLSVLNKYKGVRNWSEYYISDLRKISNDPQDYLKWGVLTNRMDHIIGAVNSGADVNFRSKAYHSTPLMGALHTHNFDAIKYLIERGADPNIKDLEGNHLLQKYTVFNSEILKYLLDHGANPDLE